MHYFLDGYNLLFFLADSKQNFSQHRQRMVQFFQGQFSLLKLSGVLVFDGSHRRGEESGFVSHGPLEVCYTSKGRSADEYIVEAIEISRQPSSITVVTNDQKLAANARALGAKSQSNRAFLAFLGKKRRIKKRRSTAVKDTESNVSRLLKIFEERLKDSL